MHLLFTVLLTQAREKFIQILKYSCGAIIPFASLKRSWSDLSLTACLRYAFPIGNTSLSLSLSPPSPPSVRMTG